MEKMRTVYWVYADVSCAAYPLTSIDTISENGKTNSNSILYSIVNSVRKNSEVINVKIYKLSIL